MVSQIGTGSIIGGVPLAMMLSAAMSDAERHSARQVALFPFLGAALAAGVL